MFEGYIEEWRALGFYCDRDTRTREYRLIGSRSGLHKFCALLRSYVGNPQNEMQSEHEHYGPYGLEVMTWPEPGMDEHSIHGPLPKLAQLALLVERRLTDSKPGDRITIREDFAPDAEFALVLDVRAEGFDPPSAEAEFETS